MSEILHRGKRTDNGEWKHGYKNGQYGIWCQCGAGFAYSDSYEVLAAAHKYCPNCGARMKGVNDAK